MFIEKYKPGHAIKISQAPYKMSEQIRALPFYAIVGLVYESF